MTEHSNSDGEDVPRIRLTCLCGRSHVIDARSLASGRRKLISLSDGWQCVSGATLRAWAKSGRLKAFRVERGRLVAWERDLVSAVQAEPARSERWEQRGGGLDAAARRNENPLLDDPELEAAS